MMGTCLSTNPTCHVIDTSNGVNTIKANIQPPAAEDQGDKKVDETIKRRALLIGITYTGPANKWSPLDGPHDDVDRYHRLLIDTYDYRTEDIIVLKDLPGSPEHLQPTRVNILRELKALVSDAAPGDRFTFFYSGHSDQRIALQDVEEEDGMDEMLIASDEEPIIDDELRQILVVPLPVGCFLFAILDTCHSGTLLDLPHYHCNSVYVPWQSKGERRTMTMQNNNVRHQDLSITSMIEELDQPSDGPPQIDSQLSERGRAQERMLFESQERYASPDPVFRCDGWCKSSEVVQHPTILSLSACSDLQRAWEGPKGSLTTVVCNYLQKDSNPSYQTLMSHINFQLHDNALALHNYTRDERKKARRGKGSGFDGELDNFQEPELSSLVKLNMDEILRL